MPFSRKTFSLEKNILRFWFFTLKLFTFSYQILYLHLIKLLTYPLQRVSLFKRRNILFCYPVIARISNVSISFSHFGQFEFMSAVHAFTTAPFCQTAIKVWMVVEECQNVFFIPRIVNGINDIKTLIISNIH